MQNNDMKLKRKVVFLLTFIALCVLYGVDILWFGRKITRDLQTGMRWNRSNASATRNENKNNNEKKLKEFKSLENSLGYCSLSTFQSELKGNRKLDLRPCVMAECDAGDINNRLATVETCNMFYCSKSKCGHVGCHGGGKSWNRKNFHTNTEGTLEADRISCTSLSFSSARRRGIFGGHWRPTRCRSKRKVAIIIPFRDREEHLCTLLKHLIPILIVQQTEFRIFVVEQVGNGTFNKGRLMNGAFLEASKMFNFNCVFFHDVDLIPENDGILYECGDVPRHLSVAVDEQGYELMYDWLIGGVLGFRPAHFWKVNGYSNMFWGWGGEDDDMYYRIIHSNLRISRPPTSVGRYTMIKHKKRKSWRKRFQVLNISNIRMKREGLNNVPYKLISVQPYTFYTKIQIDVLREEDLIIQLDDVTTENATITLNVTRTQTALGDK